MSLESWDKFLAQLSGTAGNMPVSPELDSLCRAVAFALKEHPSEQGANETLPAIYLRIASHLRGLTSGPPQSIVPPEVIEAARKSFNEAEVVAELRQIRETGGLTFEELIAGLESTLSHE
ncbi:MAG: hypothetical protein C0467_00625 [Planctomycetaceae bacterium]|nr:hypothetical protein [Planctomycetaceae bacterium]